ncbi:MAG: hypothetical protein A3F72_15200 [Bacteroidetes bacterium RIFCSPLOWO2_12_FULL_35_15]|nr:MAG: hypothetical protein A3F72_15200 [Bacteroidetes bacterium RIFCSPLOWO2_12_FULL_35_15]
MIVYVNKIVKIKPGSGKRLIEMNMIQNLFILSFSLFLVIKGAMLSVKYADQLAVNFQLSKYVVGFIFVAIISILPEALISINSSLEGVPAFGLATLFASNVADLTIVFAIIIFVSGRSIKIESKILKNNIAYPFLFLMPVILGLDGYYSRIDGTILITSGVIFFYFTYKAGNKNTPALNRDRRIKNLIFLILSILSLMVGSHFTVTSAVDLAHSLRINPILIGIFIVAIGTTIPELIFSIKAVKKQKDSLAVAAILGTVLADATIIVGIMAIINPFSFPQKIIYVTGIFMLLTSFILYYFMYTEKNISKKEGLFLFVFWIIFILTEFFINN